MAGWFEKNDPAKSGGDWFQKNDPDTTVAVRAHARKKRGLTAKDVAQSFVEALPGMGGAAGGLLGAPAGPLGAIGGAGLGGLAGQAARTALRPAVGLSNVLQPPAVAQQARELLGAGIEQAALEGGGQVLAGGGRMVGRFLGSRALNVPSQIRGRFRALDAGKVLTEEGRVPVGKQLRVTRGPKGIPLPGGGRITLEGGASTTERLVKESGRAEKLLRQNSNQLFDLNTLAAGPIAEAEAERMAMGGGPLTAMERTRILVNVRNVARKAIADRTGGAVRHAGVQFTPEEVHVIEQYAQKNARKLYTDAGTGTVQSSSDKSMQNIAGGARQLLTNSIPGYAEQASKTQKLRFLNQAMNYREFAPEGANLASYLGERYALSGLLGGAAGAYGYSTGEPSERLARGLEFAGLGAVAGSPQFLSQAALMATSPMVQMTLRQTPRLIDELMAQPR